MPLTYIIIIAVALTALALLLFLLRNIHRRWRPAQPPPSASSPETRISARRAVLENISLFAPLLPQLLTDKLNNSAWRHAVATIDNPELSAYFKKAKGRTKIWMKIMKMWGISPDSRSVFTAMQAESESYHTPAGEPLTIGKRYVTKDPCWLLTDSSGTTLLRPGTATIIL